MIRRALFTILLLGMVLLAASCSHKNKKVTNPIANVNSAQPDKVLFDRAMDAMQHGRYDVARLSLQTMINTYPDSEYVARAKLAVGDSWYAEGGSAGLAQAEIEYKDFITFFPNMPEAAEAQLKVANIHYRQMEKPDRDFTHAKRAEEEYKQLIQQFPDSKLVPEAKQRLREVQEVLAEREFRIGRFYYLKYSWAAAVARFKSVADTYPLYSGADEALFLLGQANEHLAERARTAKMDEALRAAVVKHFDDDAADAYDRILTRYPVMGRAKDARARLEVMHRPVPKATPEAVAQNKQEEESRHEVGQLSRLMISFHHRPDVSQAAKVGEPTLVPPRETGAPDVTRDAERVLMRSSTTGPSTATIQTVPAGAPPPVSQPVPRTDTPSPADTAIPELKPVGENAQPQTQAPLAAPAQINEASPDSQSSSTASSQPESSSSSSTGSGDTQSSSKKKKKKKKLLIF